MCMKTEQQTLEWTSTTTAVPFVIIIKTILIASPDCFDGKRDLLRVLKWLLWKLPFEGEVLRTERYKLE